MVSCSFTFVDFPHYYLIMTVVNNFGIFVIKTGYILDTKFVLKP